MTELLVPEFNPEMLVLARARRRLSQSELATITGIGQAVISKLEHAVRAPSSSEIEALCRALDVPATFFARPAHERFFALPPLFRLQRKRVSRVSLDQLNAEMQSRAMHLRELLRSVDLTPALPPVPALDEVSPEEAAAHLRHRWLIRPGPVVNLTALLEAAGVFVIELDTDVDEFVGCAFRAPGLPSIIFVRADQPADRRRFTLAHELGHLVLHANLADDIEKQANAFAQELLMPAKEARVALGPRPRVEQLRRLKREWKISIQAMVMRADSLGLVSPMQKSRLFQEIAARGWRMHEPDEPAKETPHLFADVLEAHRGQLEFSAAELATALRETEGTVLRMYNAAYGRRDRKGLRMV